MEAAAPSSDEIVILTARGARERRPASAVRSHSFRHSGFLAASELRRLRQRHEQFVRSLAARLAIFLRLELSLSLARVQIESYQKFIESLSNPTYITLFKTEPLKGAALLVIPPRLALTLVDRLLGGPGQMPPDGRDLTDIEVALSDQSAMLILSEWCNHWPEMRDLHATILGHENNSKFLQTSPPETSMLIIAISASVADQSETIQIVYPYATIEPLMRLLNPGLPGTETAAQRAAKPRWNPGFDEVKVALTAEWQGLKISARQITELKAGDLLALEPACAAQVVVRFGNIPKFFGRPGTSDAKWAVQLTAPINP
jgi:flagellar motor switch protein FliM